MVHFIAQQKNRLISGNTRIEPDGFSTFSIINTGSTNMVLDSVIVVPPGSRFDLQLQPYVEFGSYIDIQFVGGTGTATMICLYMTEK